MVAPVLLGLLAQSFAATPGSSPARAPDLQLELQRTRPDYIDLAPANIRVSWFACGDRALRIPHGRSPLVSIAQGPSVVRLPDDRLFCTLRSMTGYQVLSPRAENHARHAGRARCAGPVMEAL